MKTTMLSVLTCLLVLTGSTLSRAGDSQDGFDMLAYLQFRVGESIAPLCTERFSEYDTRFKSTLSGWSAAHRERIERGRSLAFRAAEQGEGNLDTEINRRAKESKQAFSKMSEANVRARCESMLEELRVKK